MLKKLCLMLMSAASVAAVQRMDIEDSFAHFDKMDVDDKMEIDDPILPFYDTPAPRHYAPQPIQPNHSYILRLRFPASIKKHPPLCGYYKGYRLCFNTDQCLINEKTPSDSFTLVITDDVSRRWQNNTTKDLKRSGSKCRMFYITKKYNCGSPCWDVEEEDQKDIPIVLPKASIILIFNPDLVDKLNKTDGLMKVKMGGHNPLYLPIIELKSDVTAENLADAEKAAWCAAPDTRGIHCTVSSEEKKLPTMTVAMNTLQR